MIVLHTIGEFRAWRRERRMTLREAAAAFVPTMGALHEGHGSLVRRARAFVDGRGEGTVMGSIFVNPTQFGPQEDFTKYPRTLEADVGMLAAAGCDAVFVPSAQEMYPGIEGQSTEGLGAMTSIDPGPLAEVLEGAIRPGHFRGVCTVVAKLLNVVEPTHLLLGQKDFQQQAVVRRMCEDLNMGVEVMTCPTVREGDGLAMSSRNRYLSAKERSRAVALYEALTWAKGAYEAGERLAAVIDGGMRERMEARGLAVQYALAAEADSLRAWAAEGDGRIAGRCVLLVAAKLGGTRLIDNMLLERPG